MDIESSLNQYLLTARRRRLAGVLLTDAGMVLAVVGALFSVLLLAGVQVISAGVVLALGLLALALLAWRLHAQRLSTYQTAQEIDRAWGLPDTLSTSFHYEQSVMLSDVRLAHLQPLIQRQHQDAAAALQARDIGEAFPVRLARAHLVALLICTVAFALFGYRYFQSEQLDLNDQLAALHIPFLDGTDGAPAMVSSDERYRPEPERPRSPLEDYQPQYDPSRERLDGTYNDMPPVTGINVSDSEPGESSDAQNLPTDSTLDMRNEMAADPRRQKGGNPDGADRRDGDNKQAKSNDSLFDKFQQAMSNMMDKFSNRNNDAMEQRGDNQKQEQAQNAGDKQGDGSDDSSDREGNQRTENPQGSENAQEGLGGQQAQDMGKQNAGAQESAADAPSSAGAEDGAKELAAARQMEAMGQIAEILGQRTEQVKGEMKMEVEAQKEQSLTTALRTVRATHQDSGGEMSRDEVPLRLQNYVKEYLKAARDAESASKRAVPNR